MYLHFKIKEARKKSKLTIVKVSELLGITRQTYSDMESGKTSPTFERVVKLSEITGYSLNWFAGIDESLAEKKLRDVGNELISIFKVING